MVFFYLTISMRKIRRPCWMYGNTLRVGGLPKANLTNSTPIQPVEDGSQYNLINHCRWDKLIDVLPSLIFKPSLNNFVLKNFTVNNIVAMPILYKLA